LSPSPQGEGLGVRSKNKNIKYLPHPSPLLEERELLHAISKIYNLLIIKYNCFLVI